MNIKTATSIALAIAASLASVDAARLTYTSKSAFVGDLLPGFYLEDFTSLPVNFDTPYFDVGFTNETPAVGYVVSAPPSGLYRAPAPDAAIGNWDAADAVIVTFTTGNVRTIGADFFLLNFYGQSPPRHDCGHVQRWHHRDRAQLCQRRVRLFRHFVGHPHRLADRRA